MRASVVGGEKIEVGRICKCCDFSIEVLILDAFDFWILP